MQSLFSDVIGDDVGVTFPANRRDLDFEASLSTPVSSQPILSTRTALTNSIQSTATISEQDAMDLLLVGNTNSNRLFASPASRSIRDNLVVSSFVAMESDNTSTTSVADHNNPNQTSSNRLFSKLEGHGLVSNDGGGDGDDRSQGSTLLGSHGEDISSSKWKDATSTNSVSATATSSSSLFKDNVTASVKKEKKLIEELTYETFMTRLMSPLCADLKSLTRYVPCSQVYAGFVIYPYCFLLLLLAYHSNYYSIFFLTLMK